ncbi:MAG: (2Fe-2S) ferredoxin domain-containing protein, partial [Planctomycetota bacterium]
MGANRIKSLGDLEKLRAKLEQENKKYRARVLVCMTGCRALGAKDVAAMFRERLEACGLADEVAVVETGCIGICAQAPVVLIEPHEYLYGGVKPKDVDEIISVTLEKGQAVERLTVVQRGQPTPAIKDLDFYSKQTKLVLENCGRIDPRRIEDAIERGGYRAAIETIGGTRPQDVIDEVTRSDLRGRGGAGFPAGMKWKFCSQAAGDQKYLICNADEGDPGAFMDRAILEGDPHRVIEGMMIAAYAIGASEGFIYVRAEYPIA